MRTEFASIEADPDIQRQGERLRAYIQHSTEAVYCLEMEEPVPVDLPEALIIDLLYRHAYLAEVNQAYATMIGSRVEELPGTRLESFLPQLIPENRDFLKQTIAARFNVTDLETTEVYNNEIASVYLNSFSPVIENGLLLRLWGTARDVTERKRLENQLQQSNNDLQKLAGRLIFKQENELRRLARELHDNLTQKLAVLAIEAGNLETQEDLTDPVRDKISGIKDQLIRVSKEVHDLSRDLHPSIIEDLGLERALQSECNNFSSRTGFPVILNARAVPTLLSNDVALALYRIVQEGLSNAAAHAMSNNVYVFLEGLDDSIVLMVRDTGIGFNPEEVRKKPGLGLSGMRERVRLIDGEFAIKSKPGRGTSLEVIVPLERQTVRTEP